MSLRLEEIRAATTEHLEAMKYIIYNLLDAKDKERAALVEELHPILVELQKREVSSK